jgi:NAD+ kinase|tara:strand:- start:1228 stop:2061 length:834 start_codon:yes stop_codon:yes gene_type:complete
MKKIGITYHPLNEAALPLAKKVAEFLDSSGVSTWLASAWEGDQLKTKVPDTDLILTIGGDGTILRTAQAVASRLTPITGINLGKLGFMTEFNADEVMAKLPALLAGEGWIDKRAILEAKITANDEEPKSTRIFYALNDVVVARGEIARIISVDASINAEPLATYQADGVIMATATGSTGYSLAAGGPILHPQADEYLLVPILPHLSLDYTLVLPPATVVKLKINTTYQATLSIDGHISLPLSSGATITIKHSSSKIRFLRICPKNYFYNSLEQKLRG